MNYAVFVSRKLFRSKLVNLLLIPVILFFIFVLTYSSYLKSIPLSYWDEYLWIGRSYFFEYFVRGDFKNPIWQSFESYDQPKFMELFYGAWLYPIYLQNKNDGLESLTYAGFLMKNGFYEVNENYIKNQGNRYEYLGMYGTPEEWVSRYGVDSLKPIRLMQYGRFLNVLLLTGAVVLAYYFLLHYKGVTFGVLASLFYGFNSLIIDAGLRANSEALFLLTFNAALLFMSLFFAQRKMPYFLLFSLFAGLTMSTKINGVMLLVIFFFISLILGVISKLNLLRSILIGIVPLLLALVVFISLNPFVYSDPVRNTQYMFDSRAITATNQAINMPIDYIADPLSRIERVFGNFYFSQEASDFRGIKPFEQFTSLSYYGGFVFVMFIGGLVYLLRKAFNRKTTAIVLLLSFVMILVFMAHYLLLDWRRYYVQLVLFFILLQTTGLFLMVRYASKKLHPFHSQSTN